MNARALMFAGLGLVMSMIVTAHFVAKDMERIRAEQRPQQNAGVQSTAIPGSTGTDGYATDQTGTGGYQSDQSQEYDETDADGYATGQPGTDEASSGASTPSSDPSVTYAGGDSSGRYTPDYDESYDPGAPQNSSPGAEPQGVGSS